MAGHPWAGKRTDITEHTVHWLDSANEYTFQVRAENALGGGISASVKARPGKPAVSRPTLTIEKVTGKDNVIAGKRDATRPVQQGSLVNGVFMGNGTYHGIPATRTPSRTTGSGPPAGTIYGGQARGFGESASVSNMCGLEGITSEAAPAFHRA